MSACLFDVPVLLVTVAGVFAIVLLVLRLAVVASGLPVPGRTVSPGLLCMVVGTNCLVVRLVVIVLGRQLLLLRGMRISFT